MDNLHIRSRITTKSDSPRLVSRWRVDANDKITTDTCIPWAVNFAQKIRIPPGATLIIITRYDTPFSRHGCYDITHEMTSLFTKLRRRRHGSAIKP